MNGTDLDPVFLTKIFEVIKVNPFSLKEDDEAREKAQAGNSRTLFGDNTLFGATAEEKKKSSI